MGLHRTFLFLLVVGLIIAAFRRGFGTHSPDGRKPAVPAVVTPAATPGLTNATRGDALAAAGSASPEAEAGK